MMTDPSAIPLTFPFAGFTAAIPEALLVHTPAEVPVEVESVIFDPTATVPDPVIGEILAVLTDTNPLVARMSGSGASCFAIYEDYGHALTQEARLREGQHRGWWTMIGRLR